MDPWILHPGLALLTAHVLVDFVVQSDRDVLEKERLRPVAFLRHGLQHAGFAWVLVGAWTAWWIPAAVFVAHGAIDVAKETIRGHAPRSAAMRLFVGDQLAHLVSLAAIAIVLGPRTPASAWLQIVDPVTWSRLLILAAGFAVAVRTGGVVVALGVRRFRADGPQNPTDLPTTEPRGLTGGGAMIGALERGLVFFFVLTSMPQGVGFLLAAKSILRFGDLNAQQQRVETEYVIIGTLASFAWSLAVGWLTVWSLGHLQ